MFFPAVTAMACACDTRGMESGVRNLHAGHGYDGRRKPFLLPSTRHGEPVRTFNLNGGSCGVLPAEGAQATMALTKAFPFRLLDGDA